MARGLRIALICTSGALALSASSSANEGASFEVARECAAQTVIVELDALAEWCQEHRLYGRRDGALESALHFVPDDEARRHRLKYQKKDGEWVRARSYRTPRDYGKKHLDELGEQLEKITSDYRSALLEFTVSSDVFAAKVWEDVLAIDANHRVARNARGEAQDHDGRWVLVETVRALARRSELEDEASRLLKDARKPDKAELDADERALGVKWSAAYETQHARVLGTGSTRKIADCARHAEAAIQLFAAACETDVDVPLFTVYVPAKKSDAEKLLANHPRLSAAERALARKTSSYWIGLHEVVIWPMDDEERLDEVVRLANSMMMVNRYPLAREQGWALEGVALALSTLLRGNHEFRPFDRPNDAASKLRAPEQVLERWRDHYPKTGIEELLDRPASELNRDARERATALVRFFLEARPGELNRVLEKIDHGAPSRLALEHVLGLQLPRIETRVLRWLEESV